MTPTFTCIHCGKIAPRNYRVKNKQKYCPGKECQKARMRKWKQKQYKTNPSYREKCKESQGRWRKKYPSYRFQKEYRAKHPEYVERNRELQKERNKRRKKERAPMILKTGALVLQPRDDGAYFLSKVKKTMIVNRNSLTLQPSIDGVYALFKINERKIVNRNALLSTGSGP